MKGRTLKLINSTAGLALLASLAANGYFVWIGRTVPVCTSPITDKPQVVYIKGGLLEISKITSPETFSASNDETILGIPIGKTITRIRVPAVYRYHVQLDPQWKVILKDQTFVVISPPVE